MCGITAFLGKEPCFDYIFQGLKILQNRGYDSAGICTLNPDGDFISHKYASMEDRDALERLEGHREQHAEALMGIGHTRWATHGPKTDSNAHPHIDSRGIISIVHNGIIENYNEIKGRLEKKGYRFQSQTDTEVIANLISSYLEEGQKIEESISHALENLEGTWGLVILSREHPDKLFLAKNGSPLLLGFSNHFVIAASEAYAFSRHLNKYTELNDREIICVEMGRDNTPLVGIHRENTVHYDEFIARRYRIQDPDPIPHVENCYPFPHWTIKEIMEQPFGVMRSLNHGARIDGDRRVKLGGLDQNREDLLNIENLLILGCGSSYNVARLGEKYLRHIGGFNSVQAIDASEFTEEDLPRSKPGILVLSQSGETKDVHRAMELARGKDVFIFSIVNAVGSLIARQAHCGVYLNCGREVGVAATKSFTSQVVVLALIAVWFAQQRKIFKNERRSFISSLLNLSGDVEESLGTIHQCKEIAQAIRDQPSLFVIGRGQCEPIAQEGALKIKEISYCHAEGYPGGALKHGPFALIRHGTPVFLINVKGHHYKRMNTAAEEVKARESMNILITDSRERNEALYDYTVQIPENGIFGPLLATIPLQFIAYELSVERGINPDRPRNLAKTVTVDG